MRGAHPGGTERVGREGDARHRVAVSCSLTLRWFVFEPRQYQELAERAMTKATEARENMQLEVCVHGAAGM